MYHQEDKAIDYTIFAATADLGDTIKKLVSSNFMGMVRSAPVIFNTGDTYSCSSNKGECLKLEKKVFLRKLKGIAKCLGTYGFGVV